MFTAEEIDQAVADLLANRRRKNSAVVRKINMQGDSLDNDYVYKHYYDTVDHKVPNLGGPGYRTITKWRYK